MSDDCTKKSLKPTFLFWFLFVSSLLIYHDEFVVLWMYNGLTMKAHFTLFVWNCREKFKSRKREREREEGHERYKHVEHILSAELPRPVYKCVSTLGCVFKGANLGLVHQCKLFKMHCNAKSTCLNESANTFLINNYSDTH